MKPGRRADHHAVGHPCRTTRLRRRASHDPRPAHGRAGRPDRLTRIRRHRRAESGPRPARTSGRGPCASGATDPGQPDTVRCVCRFCRHSRRSGARRDSTRIGRLADAGSRRNRPRSSIRTPPKREHLRQVIGRGESCPASSARRVVASRLPSRERRDCSARNARRNPAALSWDGRMSTWIARW